MSNGKLTKNSEEKQNVSSTLNIKPLHPYCKWLPT